MANEGFAKRSAEAVNIVFGFLVASGFDDNLGDPPPTPDNWGGIAAFVIGLTIVARYTVGAANHFDSEHTSGQPIPTEPSRRARWFAVDACFLLLYGLFARLCGTAASWQTFYVFLAAIFFQSLAWGALARCCRRPGARRWRFWTIINGASFFLAVCGFVVYEWLCLDSSLVALCFVALFSVVMIWDLRWQLRVMAGVEALGNEGRVEKRLDRMALCGRIAPILGVVALLFTLLLVGWRWHEVAGMDPYPFTAIKANR